ncbi:branched-chain amino acid ABC transporter permease [Natronorubrum halophilum]|uniref:branched-chain amino acid ABC transporter permease n=1 Tax=Natronorubrum halophilum TaxID=1702106 RepID=UPI000EF65DB6|nr:branched-chain amino acid ABC transporter permease [Natronorubrum halophilum]
MIDLEFAHGWRRDIALIGGLTAAIYVLFIAIGVFLGYDLGGVLNMLQSLTLLAAAYAMLVLALNLHWGYTGLFNIGVAGFMAVGVYTMAILTAAPDASVPGFGLPLWVGVIGGMAAAALVGLLAALPALRLKADYLAIVTLGLSEIIRLTVQSSWLSNALEENVGVATGGGSGIGVPKNLSNFAEIPYYGFSGEGELTPIGIVVFHVANTFDIPRTVFIDWTYTLLLVAFVALFYWLLYRVGNSPFGRVLKAIREDELVADSLGKNTRLFKIKVFMLGCALMGLAGMLWYGSRGYTSPDDYMPLVTFYVFVALIIGGSGSNTGSVMGGIVFAMLLYEGPTYVPRIIDQGLGYVGYSMPSAPGTIAGALGSLVALDPLPLLAYVDGNIDALRFVLLGVVLILVIQRRPDGLLGHRVETASSVDLARPARTDGGDRDE